MTVHSKDPDWLQKKILANLKKTYCRIGRSRVSGVGVIAIRDIPKNTNPFPEPVPAHWTRIPKKDIDRLDPVIRKMVYDFYAAETNGDMELSEFALNGLNVSYFLNQSRRPNLQRTRNGNFRTIRRIAKGKELFTRYADFDCRYMPEKHGKRNPIKPEKPRY